MKNTLKKDDDDILPIEDWKPEQETLHQVLEEISKLSNITKLISSEFPIQSKFLEFYFCYIFCNKEFDSQTRKSAGILLEINCFKIRGLETESLLMGYLRKEIPKLIGDIPYSDICACLISQLCKRDDSFLETVISLLLSHLASNSLPHISGSCTVISDMSQKFLLRMLPFLTFKIIPQLLALIVGNDTNIQEEATNCFMSFIGNVEECKDIIKVLLSVTNTHSIKLKINLVKIFNVMVSSSNPRILVDDWPQILQFFLSCISEDDQLLALEASEIWNPLSSNRELCGLLKNHLPQLFEVLLNRMVYSKEDLQKLGADENGNSPFDELGEEYHNMPTFNLRKFSAEALDNLSENIDSTYASSLVPLLQNGFNSSNWLIRERSVLSVGCIALKGCFKGIEPTLAALIELVFKSVEDEVYLIRSVACWVLGRYGLWFTKQPPELTARMVTTLISHAQEPYARVQKAALSSICYVIEDANTLVLPYLDSILEVVTDILKKPSKIIDISLSLVCSIFKTCPRDILDKWSSLIIVPMLDILNSEPSPNLDVMITLIEALGIAAEVLEQRFLPYAKQVFERSLCCISSCLKENMSEDEEELINACLDPLLYSIFEGLKDSIHQVIEGNDTFVPLLINIAKVSGKFSQCYLLIGAIAQHSVASLLPYLQQLVPLLLVAIETKETSISNNALWTLAIMLTTVPPEEMRPYAPLITMACHEINNLSISDTNSTVAICCVGVSFPDLLSPVLKVIGSRLCMGLCSESIKMDREREVALQGLCAAIQYDPVVMLPHYPAFCSSVAFCKLPSNLTNTVGMILHGWKGQMSSFGWAGVIATISAPVLAHLQNTYHL